jgi:D-serine deaminase-like pyridoxal phosphate-dependent protein
LSTVRRRPAATLWGLALAALLLTESTRAMAIEEPQYRVLEQDGPFELREYAPYMLAETAVEAGFMNAGNIAFGRLFRYISGANTTAAKIAMTAPVEQAPRAGGKGSEKIAMTAPVEQSAADGVYRIGFVVPGQYTPATVPQPTDPRVVIRAVPARRVAVWRYSGRWTEGNFRDNERRLRERLKQRKLEPVPGDSAIIARYNSPFAVWFLRRNEVLIPLQAPR